MLTLNTKDAILMRIWSDPMKKVDYDMTYDQVYRDIYDGRIGVKQFKQWLDVRIKQAYDQGLRDADGDPTYDDISRSQYD